MGRESRPWNHSTVGPELNDPDIVHRVNALRKLDNVTNWFYLGREYLFLAVVLTLTIGFYHNRAGWELAWWWNIPTSMLAIMLVGIGQHRLVQLGHEGSHYALFHHRVLNELASDWFCMFPIWSVTNNYRIQHLAYHQYVNDPESPPGPELHGGKRSSLSFPDVPKAVFLGVRGEDAAVGAGSDPLDCPIRSRHMNLGTGLVLMLLVASVPGC